MFRINVAKRTDAAMGKVWLADAVVTSGSVGVVTGESVPVTPSDPVEESVPAVPAVVSVASGGVVDALGQLTNTKA